LLHRADLGEAATIGCKPGCSAATPATYRETVPDVSTRHLCAVGRGLCLSKQSSDRVFFGFSNWCKTRTQQKHGRFT